MLFFHTLKVEDEPFTRCIIKVVTFFFIIIGISTCRCKPLQNSKNFSEIQSYIFVGN